MSENGLRCCRWVGRLQCRVPESLIFALLNYNLLFRWFVGLNMDDSVWDVTVFTKNRERLLDGDIAEAFFQAVLQQARERNLLSDEHFTWMEHCWRPGRV